MLAQIVVPTIALLSPPPAKFGFQMYSGIGGVSAQVVHDDGRTEHLDPRPFVAKYRPDIDWLPALPEAMCSGIPTAVEVLVEQDGRIRSLTCIS